MRDYDWAGVTQENDVTHRAFLIRSDMCGGPALT